MQTLTGPSSESETRQPNIGERNGLNGAVMNSVRSANGSHLHVLQDDKGAEDKEVNGCVRAQPASKLYKWMNDRELSAFSQELKSFTSLQSLSLKFDLGLSVLSQNFKTLISLKSLTLDFKKVYDPDLVSLIKAVGKLFTLQSLTICISEYSKNAYLSPLSQQLKKLTFLKSLTLNLYGHITSEGLSLVSQGLTALESLRGLTLELYNFVNLIREYDFVAPASLEHLTLDLRADNYYNAVTNEELIILGEWIKGLKELQCLTLSVYFKSIKQGFRSFCESIRALTTLQSLTLDLFTFWGTTTDKKFLMNELEALKPLKMNISIH